MTADGRSGLDLRFVDGGCHVVRIDLETGDWQKLDAASAPATCATARRIPAVNLSVALRGYMREVESALVEGGADPAAAFVLEIAEGGEATAHARDFAGDRLSTRVPRFPLTTPLRRIDVSTVGLARPAAPDASSSLPIRSSEPRPSPRPRALDRRCSAGAAEPPGEAPRSGRHAASLTRYRADARAPAAAGALARGLPHVAHPDYRSRRPRHSGWTHRRTAASRRSIR